MRYEAEVEDPTRHGLCHCEDCRRSAGAPAVAWLAVPKASFRVIQGQARRWDGTNGAERYFCGDCGTGLYYFNEGVLPGIADIQSATLDNPGQFPPTVQIQCAERLGYMAKLGALPEFERFPGG